MHKLNPWTHYHRFLSNIFNVNYKIINTIASMSHSVISTIFMSIIHIFGESWPLLYLSVIVSLGYYIHDLRNENVLIVQIHHIVTALLLPYSLYAEPIFYITLAYGIVEFSNIPMYFVLFLLRGDNAKYWHRHPLTWWLMAVETLFFIIFRLIMLPFIICNIQNGVVLFTVGLIYLGSCYWTYGMARRLIN